MPSGSLVTLRGDHGAQKELGVQCPSLGEAGLRGLG